MPIKVGTQTRFNPKTKVMLQKWFIQSHSKCVPRLSAENMADSQSFILLFIEFSFTSACVICDKYIASKSIKKAQPSQATLHELTENLLSLVSSRRTSGLASACEHMMMSGNGQNGSSSLLSTGMKLWSCQSSASIEECWEQKQRQPFKQPKVTF